VQRNGLGEWTAYTQQRNKICRACHPFLTLAENEAPKSPPSSSIIPKENPFFQENKNLPHKAVLRKREEKRPLETLMETHSRAPVLSFQFCCGGKQVPGPQPHLRKSNERA